MDVFAFPPIAALLDLAYAGFMGLASLLEPVAGASAAAAAVVLVTLLVRTALIPVGISQAKAEQTRVRLAPRLRELQKRHRKNPERLQRETMQLYRDERTSPFAGCLPVLLQAPVIGLVYAVFLHPTIAGHANGLLSETLFGVPLGVSLTGAAFAGTLTPMTVVVIGAVVVLIAAVGELTRRMLRVPTLPRDEASPIPAGSTRMLGLLQYSTAVGAVFVPLAAGLYLLTTVAWTLGQRLILRRVYPLG
ncbi:YidC/Oxa1 family membrane protein insertase [Microbacterium sp.]|jgi:YidC/Oxa1 family membrane protein insertase|uniref:YidC/Oxa1 family membrane protein insertase n=1 Tax=Microbacterium sp. TaxID=51671 RepID=UPI002BA1F581|nr:membrane protein insertase YidC [Microbacterium sp.]HWL77979.1 membrane protein insertase YidC [Microbacterium sp.]